MKKTVITTMLIFLISFACFAKAEDSDSIGSQVLDEIVVKGEKPQVKADGGKMIVDLPSIVRDKPVTNILEALPFLPGVTKNNDSFQLAGTSGVTIILNGTPTNMPIANLYQLLSATPIDKLKNVEVSYTAPAKYHTKGAVINIVLKSPNALDGLRGQVSLGYNQAHYASYSSGFAASYAVKKWSFDLNYSLDRSKSWNHEGTFSNHLFNGERTLISDDQRRTARGLSNLIYAAAAYKFSEKSNLQLTYNGQIKSDINTRSISKGTLGDFTNTLSYPSPISYHNIAFVYTAPWELTIGGAYTNYREKRTQNLFSIAQNTSTVIASNHQSINHYSLYIDKTHSILGYTLGYGAHYQHSNDFSSQSYTIPANPGFSGTLREDVADAYISLQHSFPWGFSFDATAKGEYFNNNTGTKWNFIPQLGATFYTDPMHIFQLSFTSDRVYPSYWELHSGTGYINAYSRVLGNPDLQPYINYSSQLSYILRQKYVATLYFQYSDKMSVQLPYQSPSALELLFQTTNLDFKSTTGINITAPFNIKSILNTTATVNFFHQREKSSHFHDISFDNKKWVFYGSLNNSIRFSSNLPLSLSIDFSYISPSLQGISGLSELWKIDAGVKWKFAKNRSCELNLRCEDIFNTWSPIMSINHAGQDYRMKVYDMTQNFKLSFIWRFNGFKPKDTSIDASRFGTGN